ncbi:MAG: hypothetical protein ACLTSZ_03850 [Lachnospiraceae bacterium]
MTNHTLENVLYENFAALGVPSIQKRSMPMRMHWRRPVRQRCTPVWRRTMIPVLAGRGAADRVNQNEHAMNAFLAPPTRGCVQGFRLYRCFGDVKLADADGTDSMLQHGRTAVRDHCWQNVSCDRYRDRT